MHTPILLPVIVLIVAVIVAAALGTAKSRRKPGTYKARKLLTENELEFFDRLVRALPDHYIFPQVAMSALLASSSSDRKQAYSDHLRIAQHRADYVICNLRCKVIAVVELDDRTHSRAKDDLRDGRLQQGGIRTIRFQSRNKPTVDAIRAAVLPAPSGTPVDIAKGKQDGQVAKFVPATAVLNSDSMSTVGTPHAGTSPT